MGSVSFRFTSAAPSATECELNRVGYPASRIPTGNSLNIESSWAKHKGERFYKIVRKMKRAGLKGSFTLALQSLDDRALENMHRKNMKLNEFEDLARWLQQRASTPMRS